MKVWNKKSHNILLMKITKILTSVILLTYIISGSCKYEKDPGLFVFNGTIKGQVINVETKDPISGAKLTIWVKNEPSFDTLEYMTDENGNYQTAKMDINTQARIINIEASKYPDYELTRWDGQEFEAVNTPGEIWGGNQFDTWYVNFGLSQARLDYMVIPDSLSFVLKYDPSDPADYSEMPITILNTGTAKLKWKITAAADWINTGINPDTQDSIDADEFKIINIGVSRTMLTPGNYSSTVEITTNSNPYTLPVNVTVY
jgi:hypothetical protein